MPFCPGDCEGPSSTTQSPRSMRDDFRPRIGGEGDGDMELEWGGVNGAIGVTELASGDIGSSSMLGEREPGKW